MFITACVILGLRVSWQSPNRLSCRIKRSTVKKICLSLNVNYTNTKQPMYVNSELLHPDEHR